VASFEDVLNLSEMETAESPYISAHQFFGLPKETFQNLLLFLRDIEVLRIRRCCRLFEKAVEGPCLSNVLYDGHWQRSIGDAAFHRWLILTPQTNFHSRLDTSMQPPAVKNAVT
jgi:hypothetical protein